MRVLVLGATGFIGFPAAQAFARAGHIVYGLTRNAAKSKSLAAEEIIPIVGDPAEPSQWLTKSLVSTLDVIIEAIGGTDIKTISSNLLEAVTKASTEFRPPHAPKLTFIYTSGTWVHGDSLSLFGVSDTTPLLNPTELVQWRPAFEQQVIHHTILNGIVIRPALLYGKSASILEYAFKPASEGQVTWWNPPDARFALIHTDDLAELYVLAAEKAQLVRGKIFDAANDFTESVDDFLKKLVEVSGAKGPVVYRDPTNLFEKAITTTSLLRPYLARSLLGWRPRKAGLVDYLEIYYNAWKASAGL